MAKKAKGSQSGRSGKSRKRRERTIRVASSLPEGIPTGTIEEVPLEQIDLVDHTFQIRVYERVGDLRKSLAEQGQQVPVVLWGKQPYKIIDGFRRVAAIQSLGWPSVKAIIRKDLNEDEAFSLSFIENVKRKNLSPLDRANAIWSAVNKWGKKIEGVAQELGISEKQANRYLSLLDLPAELKKAVNDGTITMAHAAILGSAKGIDVKEWNKRIVEEDLKAAQVKKALKSKIVKAGRPKKYAQVKKDYVRIYPFVVTAGTSDGEREKIIGALGQALKAMEAMA